ncbi:MAG: hypothetical protein NC347_00340 [Clostridium sp.]|nr:hypothetical protein [Clostridium sp.]
MTEKQIAAIEKLGWTVKEYDDEWLIENYSPAGAHLPLEIPKNEDIVEWLKKNADSFSPDDHVELYIPMRGQHGVPESVRTLLEDAEAIKTMYQELAEAVKNAEMENSKNNRKFIARIKRFFK